MAKLESKILKNQDLVMELGVGNISRGVTLQDRTSYPVAGGIVRLECLKELSVSMWTID